ncbi:MAG: tyrosine--tRNA ligase [Gemmataceae bacterium]
MPLSADEQFDLLTRGAAHIEKADELRKKLASGRPLRVKYGIDPTGFDVHLGHTVPLRKLKQFQELGHTAVLIIGTATAAVGDPSGRDSSRAGLTPEQIETNAATYLEQIAKVVDVSKAEVRPNADWFNKFGFADMLKLLGSTTVQRMLERDDFSNRIKSGTPIYLHECLYPLMQGWDSVEIKADVELGGTEQLYNLMVGRDLQRAAGQEPQVCLTMPILRGTDGVKKMGKSVGNYVALNETPADHLGKTMSIPDDLLREWFTLLSDRPPAEIDALLAGNPKEAKKALGAEIVRQYHGAAAAETALADWKKQREDRTGDPEVMPEFTVPAADVVDGAVGAIKLIVLAKFCASNGEARRKIEEGAFNYGPDRTKPADPKATVPVSDGLVVRLGRKVARVRLG